ncbi:hypothetical protein Hypma_010449 [Hypsizygus marmoreus]|uniref:Uncharacterized protein n=1 Tax=Hypsizygus marmoreus TaxID=39966 RepID=A0A369K8G2_HYPMA|nr:hypothetical protein Hypma_010449 [Hypsizygus marmoreus]
MDAVSKKPPMRPLDPLLIQSFPAPPTHIPVTPTSPNPPPSRPPSTPLPPVPGPSRISGHETFLLLQQGASRSRRSSKLSLASVDRDTTLSRPPSAASPPHSPSSITHPHSIAFSISEELDGLPPADDDDILLGIDVPAQMPSPSRRHNPANESISSIDVRDILDAAGGADYYSDDADTLGALPPLRTPSTRRVHRTKHTSSLSLADPIDPQTIPRTQKTSSPPAPPRSPPSPDITAILSTTPRPVRSRLYSSSLSTPSAPRLPSTKRRASEGLGVSRSSSRSKPRLSDPVLSATRYADSPQGFTYDEDGYADREDMDDEAEDDDDTRSWIDHDEYGKPIPYTKPTSSRSRHEFDEGDRTSFGADDGHYAGEDKDTEERYRQLEGYASGSGSGSESSLDLHTPLPHLMVRHGLLSPRSKLLPQPESQANGRESVVSLASTKTNTSLLKDSRDTVTRRVRHRDGKLLKGGIGLTTGLGWSDSEDEDAPSALTRRISSLNLSRRSSLASLSLSTSHHALSRNTSILSHSTSFSHTTSTSHVHPPSRAYSSSTLHEGYMHESELGIDEWGALTRSTSESNQTYKPKTNQPRWSSHSLPSSSSSARKHQLPKPKTLSGMAPTAWSGRANGSGRMSVASNTSASSGFSSSGVTGMIQEEDEGLTIGGGGSGERASTSAALLAAGVSASVRRGLAQGPVMRSRTPTSTSSHGVYNGRTPVAVPVPTRRRTEEDGVGVGMNNTSTSSLSTASSLSIPLPITPLDGDDAGTTTTTTTTGLAFIDKSLPPLPTPTPTLRRSPGSANLSAAAAGGGGDKGTIARGGFAFPTQPRARAISSSAVGSGSTIEAPALVGSYSGPPPPTTATSTSQMMSPPTPRPLRLAQSPYLRPKTPSSLPTPTLTRDRPAVPVPVPSIPTAAGPYLARAPLALSGFASNAAASSSTPSLVVYHSTPGTPRTPLEKPKPRTGTGMVYRSTTGPSRMRLPSAAAGVGGSGGGGGVGAAKVQVQVQAGGPRAIAL